MADPFSVIAATIGVIDVCVRFSIYLKDVQAGAKKIDDEIAFLSREVEALQAVNETIQATYRELQASSSPNEADSKQVRTLWRNIKSNLQDCLLIVEELETLVQSIAGKEVSKDSSKLVRKFDGFRKQLKKQSKEGDFYKLQSRLGTYHNTLQLMLDLIILTHARKSHAVTNESIEQLNLLTGKSFSEIKIELVALQEALKPPDYARSQSLVDLQTLKSPNEHFSIPQGVENDYTGRLSILEDVKNALTTPSSPGKTQMQKRIVIYGVGGSGKTQFCCKYAQLYREIYWGVFWIDASSDELAKQKFQKIAKDGKVDDSIQSVKHWLSNQKNQWLLIIDNADNPDLSLKKYIPEGERGHVLITTRIPSNKGYGTVRPRSFHFQGLKDDEASALLLKTASKPAPWDVNTRKLAASITQALGFLPLALIHAGKAILDNLCNLGDYLHYHRVEKQKVREARDFGKDKIYINVYSSFEINFRGLQKKHTKEADDAIQLLQMFSFFHRENIRIDFLTKAATNPAIERKSQEEVSKRDAADDPSRERKSWSSTLKRLVLEVGMFIYKERTPPVLPYSLRDNAGLARFDIYRLKAALNELTQLSLVTYNDVNDSYSMHPVVHTWARERPQFRTVEQAVWCEAATTALAQSIMLPPLASTEADETFRHDLLPHIDHVRERQKEIYQQISENRQRCMTAWLHGPATATRTQIGQMARFSRVYAQGGKWDEALKLQLAVKRFCLQMLGPNHTSTMMIKLALSGTYWQLSQGNQAAELQEEVLHAYEISLGENHPKTLKIMDVLGESRWQQGRFTDSLKLHEKAYNGMMNALGPGHEDTLKAANNLGRAHAALWHPEEARRLLKKAVNGMKRNDQLGPEHLNTLIAMNDLAMTYMANEGGTDSTAIELEQARQLMAEVHSKREKKLGKEHPYTLWAVGNFARVKAAMGDLEEAEADMRAGLEIAERNLGETHLGVFFGKLHLGDILIKRERYHEAEELLIGVADGQRHLTVAKDGEYPDRVKALDNLSKCYGLQGRIDEAVEKCGEAIHGMRVLGAHAHPYMEQLRAQEEDLVKLRSSPQAELAISNEAVEPSAVRRAVTFG